MQDGTLCSDFVSAVGSLTCRGDDPLCTEVLQLTSRSEEGALYELNIIHASDAYGDCLDQDFFRSLLGVRIFLRNFSPRAGLKPGMSSSKGQYTKHYATMLINDFEAVE